MAMGDETKKEDDRDDLAEAKRIMERLVRTPPKPHKEKGEGGSGRLDRGKKAGKRGTSKQPKD